MTSSDNKQVPASYKLQLKGAEEVRVAVCYSEWNSHITHPLRDGAVAQLRESGLIDEQIALFSVPGAFELTHAAAKCLAKECFDAIIVLGCVIRGETSHYDLICNAVAEGITALNLEAQSPIIFGLVTTENQQQAVDRSGGKLGNKGQEAAIAALQMIDFSCRLENKYLPLHTQKNDSPFIS